MEVFIDQNGVAYDESAIVDALRKVGAHDCEHLFLHSDIVFGRIAKGMKRKEYLGALYDSLKALGVKSLIIPTFSYSFNNGEDYDVVNSKSYIGALNEYIRVNGESRYRTMDPLLSVSVNEDLKGLFDHPGDHSLGEGCALDTIHHMDGVKFLFFGIHMRQCFTYLHYIEKMLDVPYRFDKEFEGDVIDYEGNRTHKKQSIHTQLKGVKLLDYEGFENRLINDGLMKEERLGDRTVACISEKDIYREIVEAINRDPNSFLEEPFDPVISMKEYTFGLDGSRITHC